MRDEKRCRTCKHFDGTAEDWIVPKGEGWGACMSPKIYAGEEWDVSMADTYAQGVTPKPKPTEDCAYAVCDESRGSLFVGPLFGCIHHEE